MTTVLLVEDDELSRDMLSRRLTRKGYSVITAPDGEAGVALASERSPDVILMDLNLPGIDGTTAMKTLKAQETTASIPVIALTAHAMSGDREKILADGFDGYDTKPVEIQRLVDNIVALVGGGPE